jgi:uracil-DNA glycosylase
MIVPEIIHPAWNPFLENGALEMIKDIESKIFNEPAESITPAYERMLRFLQIDLSSAKVVVIGQDPYPQAGVATGRAFEVGTLKNWSDRFRNTSLRNIVRALYASQKNDFKTFNEIKKEMAAGEFQLLPPDRLFKYWESQGVLLLNTSFSCRVGKPGSHARLWHDFTTELLVFINESKPNLTWFLWGNKAKEAVAHLQLKNSIETTHPMICHQRSNYFLFGKKNVFRETAEMVDWYGCR